MSPHHGRPGPAGWTIARAWPYYAARKDGELHCTLWLTQDTTGLGDRLVGVARDEASARDMVADMAAGR